MAEPRTLARPYAKAIFELAREQKKFADWSKALAALAAVVADPKIAALVGHPKVTRKAISELIVTAAGKDLPAEAGNLVQMLSQNSRLGLIDTIAEQYEALRADAEKRLDVTVVSAAELSGQQKNSLAAALKKRLGREIVLECSVDKNLLGGAIIRAGDLVIDGSVKSELQRLAQTVSA